MSDSEPIIPFVPVRYSQGEGLLAEIMAGRNVRAGIRIGKLGAQIRFFYDIPEAGPAGITGAGPMLALEIRGRLWQLDFGRTRFLYELLEQADPNGLLGQTPAESIPRPILSAIMEAFIGPELARLEAGLGEAVSLAEPEKEPGEVLALPFCITFDTDPQVPGRLYFPEDGLDLLEKLVSGCERQALAPDQILALEKQVPIQAGTLALSPDEFSGLGPGDVLIPDVWLPEQDRLGLGLGRDCLVCTMDADAMTLAFLSIQRLGSEPGTTATTDKAKDNQPMENQETAGTPVEHPPAENTETQAPSAIGNDLELDLVFELGRTTMTVEKIRELSRGQVIKLPVLPRQGVGVDIRISNQVVARGKIVAVGQEVGIQLTETGNTGTND